MGRAFRFMRTRVVPASPAIVKLRQHHHRGRFVSHLVKHRRWQSRSLKHGERGIFPVGHNDRKQSVFLRPDRRPKVGSHPLRPVLLSHFQKPLELRPKQPEPFLKQLSGDMPYREGASDVEHMGVTNGFDVEIRLKGFWNWIRY